MTSQDKNIKKILIINPFGIGDVLFTTPVIRAIVENFPQVKVSYWCNARVREIFTNNPHIDKVFPLSRGDLKKIFQASFLEGLKKTFELFNNLRKEKFDAALDFSLDHRYGLVTKLAGIKKRIGFNYKNRGRFLTKRIDISSYSDKHIIEYYSDLLQYLNIATDNLNMGAFASASNISRAKSLLTQNSIKDDDLIIGIAPGAGASWGKEASAKHWPATRFAQIADKLIDNFKAKVIILGDNSEKPIADTLTAAIKNKAVDLTGKLTLGEFIALIKNLNLLITNDGGPLHIAVACRIPTISIFGPVDEKVYGPYPASPKHIVIKNLSTKCRPCYKNFRLALCEYNKECINSISTDQVYDAARRQIESSFR